MIFVDIRQQNDLTRHQTPVSSRLKNILNLFIHNPSAQNIKLVTKDNDCSWYLLLNVLGWVGECCLGTEQ